MKTDHFRYAIDRVLEFEGGYVNDPDDLGRETNFGVSRRSYPEIDIAALTRAEAVAIYRRDFWDPNRYGEIEDRDLAAKMLSLAVMAGGRRANRLAQIALNTAAEPAAPPPDVYITTRRPSLLNDGIMGAKTIAAVNAFPDPVRLLDRIRLLAALHFIGIGRAKYTIGWLNRALA